MTPCDVYTNTLESHYTAALVMYGAQKCRDTVEFFFLRLPPHCYNFKKKFSFEQSSFPITFAQRKTTNPQNQTEIQTIL